MKFGSAGAFARARERVDTINRAAPGLRSPSSVERGASQTMVANALETSRPNVARIEKEVDIRLSTLERCVEALGGTLEIHAVFDDGLPAPSMRGVFALGIARP